MVESGKRDEPGMEPQPASDQQPSSEVDVALANSKRSPAFQFYPKEFLSSTKVIAMTATERGVYITLLSMQWLDGSLPNDLPTLARLVRMNARQFIRLWPINLARCFTVKGDRLINGRLEKERRKQEEFRRRQSDNGKRGGRPIKGLGFSGLTQTEAKANPEKALHLQSPISDLQSPKKKRSTSRADARTLLACWNEHVVSLPKCEAETDDRLNAAATRLREQPDLHWWSEVVTRMEASDFLAGRKPGRGHEGWRADVDWFLKPGRAVKVMEGKYDNRAGTVSAFGNWRPSEAS